MEQATALPLLDGIRQTWLDDADLRPHADRLDLFVENGLVTLAGEVPLIADKKRALSGARAFSARISDRIRVTPRQPMADDEILELLLDAFATEPVFGEIEICANNGRRAGSSFDAATITVGVRDGVVSLEGRVPGLDCKRLAGVMAWWIPGSRDVVNNLEVAPADAFDSIAEAVRLVLEKDPCVEAAPVRVGARGSEVTLAGTVGSADQQRLAEMDAWYVFGVDNVINRILVHL